MSRSHYFTRALLHHSLFSKHQNTSRRTATIVAAAAVATAAAAMATVAAAPTGRSSTPTHVLPCSNSHAGAAFMTPQTNHHLRTKNNNIMIRPQPQSRQQPHLSTEFPKSWDNFLSSWRQKSFLTVVHCEAAPHSQSDNDTATDDANLIWKVEGDDASYYYERVPLPDRTEHSSHVIFGQLLKPGLIDRYEVYRRVNTTTNGDTNTTLTNTNNEQQHITLDEIVVGVLHFGQNLNGHDGIVHGGVVSLLFDDAMGFAYEAMGIKMAFTANLVLNFRKPVPAGCKALLRVYHSKQPHEGTSSRKVYFEAQLTSLDGETLYAEGTSLYIIPRSAL